MRILALIFLALFFFNCTEIKQADYSILNVQIIDVNTGEITPEQFIAIKNNRIIAVDHMDNHKRVEVLSTLDGNAAFVIPGLWDNHVHFRGGTELTEQNKEMLPLFLRFGVTSVRDAGGDITPAIQAWNQDIQNGTLGGPAIYTSGPKLDGSNPAWDGSIHVVTPEDVSNALDSLVQMEADFVKIYDGNLEADLYYQIIEEAEKRGLKITGHMPLTADLMKASELGLDGIEHLYYALTETSINADEIRSANPGYSMITPLMDSYDEELAESIYTDLAEHEFYVTPTLHIGKTLAELNITDHSADTLLNYMAPEIIETYQRRINSAARGGERYTKQRARWGEAFRAMVKPMNNAGIHILAGSDSGPFNSYVYPGESLHKELEMMVLAGLTPLEAIQTSVVNGPKFFDLENDYGAIQEGKIADFILLLENPLVDITNTTLIKSVIKSGKIYSSKELQDFMNQIRTN